MWYVSLAVLVAMGFDPGRSSVSFTTYDGTGNAWVEIYVEQDNVVINSKVIRTKEEVRFFPTQTECVLKAIEHAQKLSNQERFKEYTMPFVHCSRKEGRNVA